MLARTAGDFLFGMATGLALLGVLRALKIDSSLAVIKNDCYERLAIGQRHSPKDIYNTSNVTTVFECQLLCTEEKESCKSFSFGIGAKGNASCQLSTDAVKESADLKPIGTKADTDFDLYIKKLGCTLVIDKNNPAFDHYNKPTGGHNKPSSNYGKPKPSKPPDSGYASAPTLKPVFLPNEEVQQVQTLVSVSSGPQKPILDPYNEILVGSNAKPPFRPSALNHPYGSRPQRPHRPPYNPDRYDSRPGESNSVAYGHRPIPDKYGSYLPRPDHYGDYFKPKPDDHYRPGDYYRPSPVRPEEYYNRPQRPNRPLEYDRPKPRPPAGGYDRPQENYDRPNSGDYRPQRPLEYDSDRPHRPDRPPDYDRPSPPGNGYDNLQRPQRPERPPDYDRPNNDHRPKPPGNGYDNLQRPERPPDYDRPNNDHGPKPPGNGYDNLQRPEKPLDYDRPNNDYRPKPPGNAYDNLQRPERPLDYDRPNNDYRPKPPGNGYDNLQRPEKPLDYDRPNNDYRPKPPNSGYDNLQRPQRPLDYDRPNPSDSDYRPKPPSGYDTDFQRPLDYDRPNPSGADYRPKPPNGGYDNLQKPQRPERPPDYDRPKPPNGNYDRPNPPDGNYDRPNPPKGDSYQRPGSKPINEYLFHGDIDRNDKNPGKPSKPGSGYGKPESSVNDNTIKGSSKPEDPHSKPIVTQSVGPHGESITSIITELEEACFRRVLAGKRVTRALVKRALFCERLEDCQRECADEKHFACEGFNYRLDPTGRGKGECELLEIPLSHLDIGRDLYPDPDYDYYERDRNAASANCRGNGYYQDYDSYSDRRHDQRPYDGWNDDRRYSYGNRRPRPDYGYDSKPPPPPRPPYDGYDSRPPPYDYDDGFRPNGNRRGDFAYHESHHSEHAHDSHYEHYDHGRPPYDYHSYEPYLPPIRRPYNEDRYYNKYDTDRERDKSYWGLNKPSWGSYGSSYGTSHNHQDFERKNYYLPPPVEGNKNWGQYGGSYGNGGVNLHYNGYGHSQSFDFWGLNKFEEKFHDYGEVPPKRGGYLPEAPRKPPSDFGPERPYNPPGVRPPPFSDGGGYKPERPSNFHNNAILPAEPRHKYDFLKDECSLRTAAGFRLAKGRPKRLMLVTSIYECELLCFKEKRFRCLSYAYRYTVTSNVPTENCYLSDLSYKQLDFYTDLDPDRNFDVYTMNNMERCQQPIIPGKDDSECFWRVRSAQRLGHKVVLDSLTVKSIVECQIECLRSRRFTCRAFSFRYGSPVKGGPVDNCLLTDWPYYEMDPRKHFIPEPGFEIYERGSFGHGCEPYIFGNKGKPRKNPGSRVDQLCYAGFGSPAKLLPQATRKELQVATEEECKAECSKLRETTLFQCMSLSYNTNGPKWEPNCKLSDILQRDLLPNVDFVHDPDAWLFAWDNYNPECRAVANEPIHNHISQDRHDNNDVYNNGIGTWRVYSVSGWPCRRGTLCRENKVAGFWYCELEGGDADTWDYCCRPDHRCGFSEGFQYPWCYVGPSRTQWRKCSDRYFPYVHNLIDRFDRPPSGPSGPNYLPDRRPPPHWGPNHLPDQRPPPVRPGIRPDRPPAPPTRPPPRPSLDEYEMQFDSQFLDPPKPGGFGQPRHWPLSYLHKEMPPNATTDPVPRLMKASKSGENPKFAAIQNLIDVIKSNDLKNVQYQITNESNKADDILFVKIPLPTNFTEETKKSEKIVKKNETRIVSEPIDLKGEAKNTTKRSQKSLPSDGSVPVYRRGFITRTNVTNHRARNSRAL